MKEWQVTPLHKLGRIITGKTPPGARPESWGDGVPFLTPSDFDGGRIVEHYDRRLSPTGQKIMSRMIIPYGVAVSCIGWQMGKAVWVREPTVTNQQINSIIFDPKKVDGLFLYYNMKNRREELFRLASGGSRTPILKKSLFENLEVLHPPLEEQRAIGHILGTLDDKIEANRRMNRTMEAMAQALFRSWFLDFEPVSAKREKRKPVGMDDATASLFPEHFQETDMGPIPAGWRLGTVGEEFNLTMGQSPPGRTYNEDKEGLPFYQGRTDFGYRYPTRRIYCTAPTRFAEHGDTLVSVRAPVGDINMANERCCIGRGIAAVRHKSGDRSFTYYMMQSLSEEFAAFEGDGTLFGSINKDGFHGIKMVVPSPKVLSAFTQIVAPMDARIEVTDQQIQRLSALRDALLPQLLSGELRVGKAEKMIEEA